MAVREPGRAIVAGGSLSGLLVANLLHRQGWQVQVFERAEQGLAGRGAGIVTHPDLLQVLARAGVKVDAGLGVRVERRVTLGRDGAVLASAPLSQVLTSWGHMYALLRAALPGALYHHGRALASFDQDDDEVRVRFENGDRASADLLIAADGVRSAIRDALVPAVQPRYAGYVAWRGLVDESSLSECARRELLPYFAFCLPPHEQILGYPVAGRDNTVAPGRRRFNFVWYRPADERTTLRDLSTDAAGKVWLEGIPPPLIRPEVVAQARADAHETLAPQFAEAVEKTGSLFFQPIFDLQSPRLAFGRVALTGDAAFVARPHCGMGVTKAAGDAQALVTALDAAAGVRAGLCGYEQERLAFGQDVVRHAAALGAYMQAQLLTPHEREMAERYRSPEAVMRETAVPFLRSGRGR